MKKINKKGFTLVELLAVIVILGVVLAVAIPGVSNVLTSSRKNSAKNNALMIVKGVENCLSIEGTRCDLNNYIDGSVPSGVTVSNGKLTNFSVTFEGYEITVASGIDDINPGKLRSAINRKDFSSSKNQTTGNYEMQIDASDLN